MNKLALPFDIQYHQLDNGLRVATVPKPGFQHSFALLATNFGSLHRQIALPGHQDPVQLPAGVAHFLEHQLFEQKNGNVSDEFAALGAQDNAFTHFLETGYFFLTSRNFWPSFELLLQFSQRPYFTAENVEAEKGIITQELRMYEDDPTSQADVHLRQLMFGRHPAGEEIGGTVKSIKVITPDLLYACHQAYYHPKNMVLVVIGDLEMDKVLATANSMGANSQLSSPSARPIPIPPAIGPAKAGQHQQKMHISRPYCLIGFKDTIPTSSNGRELLKRQLQMELLLDVLFGKSCPFYWELYSGGLISDDFASEYVGGNPIFAYNMVGGETSKAERLIETVQKEIARAQQHRLDPTVVERLKKKTLGDFITGFDNSDALAFALSSSMLVHSRYEELPELLAETSPDNLQELLAEMKPQEAAISLIEPLDKGN